ncbi:MAG: arylamine N-acetyltransferase family protein [Thermomicrobiales bacterium]
MRDVGAYLHRIGFEAPAEPTLATLAGIVRAHLLAAPFENLDIIPLGRPIRLEPDALFDKIVQRRRGGFCYELNGLLGFMLETIGFRVTRVSAQWPREDGTLSPVFDHIVLLVESADSPDRWLVDVGAGRSSLAFPLRFVAEKEHDLPDGGSFRFDQDGEMQRLWRRDGDEDWQHVYSFTLTPRRLDDFAVRCVELQTLSDSHFTQGALCSLARPDGRITLSRDRLIVTVDGTQEDIPLDGAEETRAALWDHFGIDLTKD